MTVDEIISIQKNLIANLQQARTNFAQAGDLASVATMDTRLVLEQATLAQLQPMVVPPAGV